MSQPGDWNYLDNLIEFEATLHEFEYVLNIAKVHSVHEQTPEDALFDIQTLRDLLKQ